MKLRDIKDIPDTVAELFEKHPELWAKGRGANGLFDEEGNPVESYHDACKLCLGSAIGFVIRKFDKYDNEVHGDRITEAAGRALRAINRNSHRKHLFVTTWNDEQGRTVEDVIALAREARI